MQRSSQRLQITNVAELGSLQSPLSLILSLSKGAGMVLQRSKQTHQPHTAPLQSISSDRDRLLSVAPQKSHACALMQGSG
ncbi:hypothetical protein SAMN05443582_102796 [Phyllobacterium sp. OV277]|nr:hypothetical protein SAMN05443582_102796 [Phyllobacterium sp. OV277]